jgi:ABC-type dipeptide/oligopeptide/nickel transport system ATPase component
MYDGFMTPRLEVRELSVELPTPGGWIRPVEQVSLSVEAGGALGLVGESGSGKTMLALALMGLLPPGARVCGTALLHGEHDVTDLASPLSEDQWSSLRGRSMAMIFQEPMTALNPVMRVGPQIAEAIRAHDRSARGAVLRRRVRQALELAAVPEPETRARQYPHELSGGLRQRVLIAIALAAGSAAAPQVLIADEPTTALDVTVQKQILELLARLRRTLRLTLVFITHDLAVVAQVAEQLAVLKTGRVVEQGPTWEVLRAPRHPYTANLLRASPKMPAHAWSAVAEERSP